MLPVCDVYTERGAAAASFWNRMSTAVVGKLGITLIWKVAFESEQFGAFAGYVKQAGWINGTSDGTIDHCATVLHS